MHKNIIVALLEISDDGSLGKILKNAAELDHLPLGCQLNDIKFHEWWKDRAIPKTRNGAKSALQRLGYASTNSALVDNLALSLSDCYWIKPVEEADNLNWEKVNLFTNDFVDTFGELTINRDLTIDLRNRTKFNCAASQGELQKKWCIDSTGRRYMIKGNYGDSYQQSLNEVFATKLHENQGFSNYTPYQTTLVTVQGGIEGLGCLSYDFCSENKEIISAWEILQTKRFRQNQSLYYPLRERCISLGIDSDDFDSFMDYEILTDYLLTNTDRHMNNIAIVRNPDTLEIIGMAPIYDSGNSMFYNLPYEKLCSVHLDDIETHSFIAKETKLLSYVKNRDAINLNLTDIDFSIYEKDIIERHIRIPKLKELFERKRARLCAFQEGQNIWNRR